jgi:hypothetical protein
MRRGTSTAYACEPLLRPVAAVLRGFARPTRATKGAQQCSLSPNVHACTQPTPPCIAGLSGVPPWILAPILVTVTAFSHVEHFFWWFPSDPPTDGDAADALPRHLAPVLAASASAAAAVAAAAVSGMLQDPSWADGSNEGRAAAFTFGARNTLAATLAVFAAVSAPCAAQQLAVGRRASSAAPLRATLQAQRSLGPYVGSGALVGSVPAFVTWLTVGDVLVVAERHTRWLLERSHPTLGTVVPMLTVPAWFAAAICLCSLLQIAAFALPIFCTVLRVAAEGALACVVKLIAVLVDLPVATPPVTTFVPTVVRVRLESCRLNDFALLRLLHAVSAALPPRRLPHVVVTGNPLALAKAGAEAAEALSEGVYLSRNTLWQWSIGFCAPGAAQRPLAVLPQQRELEVADDGQRMWQALMLWRELLGHDPRIHKYLVHLV